MLEVLNKEIGKIDTRLMDEKQFSIFIWMCFKKASKERGFKPSKKLFLETLETDKSFLRFLERIQKKFGHYRKGQSPINRLIQNIPECRRMGI